MTLSEMSMADERDRPKPRTMTVAEVAACLSLSPSSVYRLANELRALRVAGRWAFKASDVEQWLLQHRPAGELPPEPVESIGSKIRLRPHVDERNVFLDVAGTNATAAIRYAIEHAHLLLTDASEAAARQQILESILERERLCSTALHPDVAFPHPREPERCPLGSDQILVVRSARPLDFAEAHGYRPRVLFVLLARTISLQLVWEARLSHLIHRGDFVEKILEAKTPGEVHALFAPADADGRGARSETTAAALPRN